MKIKIEADFDLNVRETISAVCSALRQKETQELLEAFSPGEDFKMESDKGTVTITKL